MKEIKLTQNQVAIVDDEDYEYLSEQKWHAHNNKNHKENYKRKHTAVRRDTNATKAARMHHEVIFHLYPNLKRYMLAPQGPLMVDHINGDTLDNRRENLRLATNSQNQANASIRKTKCSKYRGVKPSREGKWRASINIGTFNTEEEAALAWNKIAKILWGEYARLNEVNTV